MKKEDIKRIEIIAEAIGQAQSLLEIMDDEEWRLEIMERAYDSLSELRASITNNYLQKENAPAFDMETEIIAMNKYYNKGVNNG
jgi:hypothetical protein